MPRSALLLLALLLPSAALARGTHAVVLMYHRFGEARYPSTSVRVAQFDAELDYLEEHRYHVWPLARLVKALGGSETIPDRTVAITVDDAYRSVREVAWPRLSRRGWPFTVFVSTDAVDRRLPAYMTWEQMREMQSRGVAFANHSATHAHLVARLQGDSEEAWEKRVSADIGKAQRRLEEELGAGTNRDPALFAFPYGEYDTALADLVRRLGYVAFGQQSGAVGVGSDRRALPRFPVNEAYGDLETLADKLRSLPLPVKGVEPWSPLLSGENPPRMTVTLAPALAGSLDVTCYGSGQGALPVHRLSADSFTTAARKPFPGGRARYNCTAPAGEGRYYWYSHLWIVPPLGGE